MQRWERDRDIKTRFLELRRAQTEAQNQLAERQALAGTQAVHAALHQPRTVTPHEPVGYRGCPPRNDGRSGLLHTPRDSLRTRDQPFLFWPLNY